MEVIKKLEHIYKSGDKVLAYQLINSLTEYQCIKFMLLHHKKENVKYILYKNNFNRTLHENVKYLFAYLMGVGIADPYIPGRYVNG